MARRPDPTDYHLNVEGVGRFVFARRKMRDEIAAQVAYARLIDGVEPTPWLEAVCGAMADLGVLTVQGPEGWSLDELDPHDPKTFEMLIGAHRALRSKELSFRPGAHKDSQAPGQSEVGHSRIPVPAEVQPASD